MTVPGERRTGDHREVLERHRAVGDQVEIVALVVRLAEDQARLPMVAADEHDVDAGGLHPARPARSTRLGPGDMASSTAIVDAALVQPSPRAVGDALAPGRAVVEDRDPLAGPMLGEVIGDHRPLPVVAAAHAEHVRADPRSVSLALAEPGAISRIPASS